MKMIYITVFLLIGINAVAQRKLIRYRNLPYNGELGLKGGINYYPAAATISPDIGLMFYNNLVHPNSKRKENTNTNHNIFLDVEFVSKGSGRVRPGIGYELSYIIFTGRIKLIGDENEKKQKIVCLKPEAGITIFGKYLLIYGYTIRAIPGKPDMLRGHSISFIANAFL